MPRRRRRRGCVPRKSDDDEQPRDGSQRQAARLVNTFIGILRRLLADAAPEVDMKTPATARRRALLKPRPAPAANRCSFAVVM